MKISRKSVLKVLLTGIFLIISAVFIWGSQNKTFAEECSGSACTYEKMTTMSLEQSNLDYLISLIINVAKAVGNIDYSILEAPEATDPELTKPEWDKLVEIALAFRDNPGEICGNGTVSKDNVCEVDCPYGYHFDSGEETCISNTQSRTVARTCSDTAPNYATRNSPSGTTTQTRTWNTSTGTWSDDWTGSTGYNCGFSCNGGYTKSGNSCVPNTQTRTVNRTCSDTAPSHATRNSPSGTTTQTRTWNVSTNNWNSWTGSTGYNCGFSCKSGYTKSGNSCVPTNNITSCTSNSSCSANTTKKTCSGYVSARSAIPESCNGGTLYKKPWMMGCTGTGNCGVYTEVNEACIGPCGDGYVADGYITKTNYSIENNCNNRYGSQYITCAKNCRSFTYSQCPSDCTKRQGTAARSAQYGTCVELHGAM